MNFNATTENWNHEELLEDDNCVKTATDIRFLSALHKDIKRQAAQVFADLTGRDVVSMVSASIRIEGTELGDMYDHAPGMAYFTRFSTRYVEVPSFQTLEQLKVMAEAEYKEHSREAQADQEYDGKFHPARMTIRDREGHVVAMYYKNAWLESTAIPADKWQETEEHIKSLNEEATEESRWDDFHSASYKRDKAAELSAILNLCRYHATQ